MNGKKLAAIVAVVLCVYTGVMTGCKNNADDSVSLNADEQKLVGTWEIDFSAGSSKTDIEDELDNIGGLWYCKTFTGNDQKRATTQVYYDTDGSGNWSNTTISASGSWSASGGVLTLIPDNRNFDKSALPYTLTPDGKTMTVDLGNSVTMVFNKQ